MSLNSNSMNFILTSFFLSLMKFNNLQIQECRLKKVFLDISKTFDKGRCGVLIFKLQQNGISGNLLDVLRNFLNNRKQRVVPYGQSQSWTRVNAVVPQSSILGPLLFPIHINDMSSGISSNINLLADDTCIFLFGHDTPKSVNGVTKDLATISK